MPSDPDLELLPRLRERDEQALRELHDRHHAHLVRLVDLRLDPRLRRRVDPQDVVQEAWLEIVNRLPDWHDEGRMHPRLWLRLLTLQCLAQAHRRNLGAQMRDGQREVELAVGRESITAAGLADVFVSSQTSPSQAAQREELRSRVTQALDELEGIDREIVLLRHFEGLSNEDAAVELAIEPAAASKRFLRALVRLEPALANLDRSTREGPR